MKEKKIKIAMGVSGFPVISQTFIALQIAELCKQGYAIEIINMGRSGDDSWMPASLKLCSKSYIVTQLPFCHTKNIIVMGSHFLFIVISNLIRFPIPSIKTFWYKLGRLKLMDFAKMHVDAYLFQKCGKPDILHFQFATLADRFNRLKKYGFIHSDARLVCSIRGYDISRKSDMADIDWEFLFREFSLFLPVCDYFVPLLEKMGCHKAIKVVRSPVNVEALALKKKDTTKKTVRIISVGRLTAKKGFDDALRAIFILSRSFEDFRYTIVGKGPQYAMLKSKINEYNLSAKVDMLGALPPDKTLATIAGSDILIAPSKTADSGDREGIPNVVKEAMFLGLQVIATRHSGIPELVIHRRNGFLVFENSPEEIAETLHEIIQNRHEWQARSESARESIYSEYTPEKTTQELVEAYKSILR